MLVTGQPVTCLVEPPRNQRDIAMSESILFYNHLVDLMTERKVSADHLQHELGYVTPLYVRSWLEGRSRPPLEQLPAIAKARRTDPVALIAGWVIEQLPEMEGEFRSETLRATRLHLSPVRGPCPASPKPLRPLPW
jgi:hypothetical protein